MEFFGKQEKIVVTIESSHPTFTFETHSNAIDLINKALENGHTVRINKKKVTTS